MHNGVNPKPRFSHRIRTRAISCVQAGERASLLVSLDKMYQHHLRCSMERHCDNYHARASWRGEARERPRRFVNEAVTACSSAAQDCALLLRDFCGLVSIGFFRSAVYFRTRRIYTHTHNRTYIYTHRIFVRYRLIAARSICLAIKYAERRVFFHPGCVGLFY